MYHTNNMFTGPATTSKAASRWANRGGVVFHRNSEDEAYELVGGPGDRENGLEKSPSISDLSQLPNMGSETKPLKPLQTNGNNKGSQNLGNMYTNPEALVKMLSEKVRKQAERLAYLEQYKDICEARIHDFDAEHPMPVSADHLGQGQTGTLTSPHFGDTAEVQGEINSLVKKIEELQHEVEDKDRELRAVKSTSSLKTAMYHAASAHDDYFNNTGGSPGKIWELTREKDELASSLKKEIILNEEQRVLIDMLRQLNEEKLDTLGIGLSDPKQGSRVDIYFKYKELFGRHTQLESENIHMKNDLKTTREEMQKMEREYESLRFRHDEMTIRLKQIEEEKNTLCEFVVEQKSRVENLSDELDKIRSEFHVSREEWIKEKERLTQRWRKAAGLASNGQIQEDELDVYPEDVENQQELDMNSLQNSSQGVDSNKTRGALASSAKYYEEEHERLGKSLSEYKDKVSVLLDTNALLESRASRQARDINDFVERLKAKDAELGELRREVAELREGMSALEECLQRARERVDETRGAKLGELKALIEENSRLKSAVLELKDKNEESERKFTVLAKEVDVLRTEREVLSTEKTSLIEENERFIIQGKELLKANTQLERELKETRRERTRDNEESIRTLESRRKDFEVLHNKVNQLENEKNGLLDQIREQSEVLELKDLEKQDLIKDLEEKERELRDALQRSEDLAGECKNLARNLEDSLLATRSIKNEGDRTKHEYEETTRVHKAITKEVRDIFPSLEEFVKQYNAMAKGASLENGGIGPLDFGSEKLNQLSTRLQVQANVMLKEGENCGGLLFPLDEVVAYVMEWIKAGLIELEYSLRLQLDLKQELRLARQRNLTLERKCFNLLGDETNWKEKYDELRKEIDTLMEERTILIKDKRAINNREDKLVEETERLRVELELLSKSNRNLEEELTKTRAEGASFKAAALKGANPIDEHEFKTIKDKYTLISQAKKMTDELVERISKLVVNPDIRTVVTEVINLHAEILNISQDMAVVEDRLTGLEESLKNKTTVTKGFSHANGTEKLLTAEAKVFMKDRKEIDNLRDTLNNLTSRQTLLLKKRATMMEELRCHEIAERRRVEENLLVEKNLLSIRNKVNDVETRTQQLENVNFDLKRTFMHTINEEKRALDKENLRLRDQFAFHPEFPETSTTKRSSGMFRSRDVIGGGGVGKTISSDFYTFRHEDRLGGTAACSPGLSLEGYTTKGNNTSKEKGFSSIKDSNIYIADTLAPESNEGLVQEHSRTQNLRFNQTIRATSLNNREGSTMYGTKASRRHFLLH